VPVDVLLSPQLIVAVKLVAVGSVSLNVSTVQLPFWPSVALILKLWAVSGPEPPEPAMLTRPPRFEAAEARLVASASSKTSGRMAPSELEAGGAACTTGEALEGLAP